MLAYRSADVAGHVMLSAAEPLPGSLSHVGEILRLAQDDKPEVVSFKLVEQ
jgi:hypothetical protein